MKVLVCGGREYNNKDRVFEELDKIKPTLLIHGGCSGADQISGSWANMRGVPCMVFPAAWAHFGHSAGPIRNRWMIEHGQPDVVIAFPGGRGTASMKSIAQRHNIPVNEIL